MVGGHPEHPGDIIRRLDEPDNQLWESVEEDLFLDQRDGRSRVEVYPAHLLLPQVVEHQPLKNDGEQIGTTGNIEHGPSNDDKDKSSVQLIALSSPERVADYTRTPPKFQAFFIRQSYSWGPLLVTSELFSGLLHKARLPQHLKSFIMFFGAREREVEISPPPLAFTPLSIPGFPPDRGHQCTYGLRFVERNRHHHTSSPSKAWSLRQCAVSCRYGGKERGASWAFVTISADMQQRLDAAALAGNFRHKPDPFEVHQLLVDSAITSWRQYLLDLSGETDAHYTQILGTSPNDKGPVNLHEAGRRQDLLMLDEALLNALLAITATTDTSSALFSSWEFFVRDTSHLDPVYLDLVRRSFAHHQRSLALLSAQVTHLRTKLGGITSLLSSFLDLSSGYSLQNLALQAGEENEEMHRLAEKSTQDAAAVKVLTILTLIYLPVTVVSNFFSTSFVSSTTSADGLEKISVTGDWWILLAASVPLTLLTIYIWLVWTRIQANAHSQVWWKYMFGIHLFSRAVSDASLDSENCTARTEGTAHIEKAYSREPTDGIFAHGLRRTSSGLC
ncbi:hypothetical protein PV08_04454 [Exophiala spinifera]|uniref:CorA-like transporter domain-containing protein n=1 Tax=Exophiala spinifera TaxID=91928 RepID=A0A0D2BE51_9EURO|nr:uncharacterized protein PV08_04454 [Exophiala spinifera]KIW17263.1 hypothetical protein PV08_04454 [Exophiala spinifera]